MAYQHFPADLIPNPAFSQIIDKSIYVLFFLKEAKKLDIGPVCTRFEKVDIDTLCKRGEKIIDACPFA